MEALKTIQDLLQASGFSSRSFIYEQIAQGKLAPPIKIGRSSRWKQSDVEQWLSTLTSENPRGLSILAANQPQGGK